MVREQIKVFAGTKKLFHTGVKLVILDEADNMTNAAQFALRRSILFQPLNPQLIRSRLLYILRQEKYPIPAGILK